MSVICGRNEEALQEAAGQLGWSEGVTDWKELVSRSDIDLIDINAPSNAHKEIALAAAAAGKHIFCEKPLALNLADSREMLQAAEAAGIVHMVGFNYRFSPAVRLAKRLIEAGGSERSIISVPGSCRTGFSILNSRWSGVCRRRLPAQDRMGIWGRI